MKTNAIIRIVIYSFLVVLLVGIMLFGMFFNEIILRTNISDPLEHKMNAGFSFEAERISKIDIDWAAGSIQLIGGEPTGTAGDITLMPNGNNSEYPITYEFDGDTLRIAYTNASVGILVGSIPERNLTIYVPKRWLCEKLDIDGAALELTIDDTKIGSLEIDGAACTVRMSGSLETLDCDGASCSLVLNCSNTPTSIDLDGVSCELDLTLPKDCGFLVQLNGLSNTFHSSLSYSASGSKYSYGNQQCRIDADGMSCKVSINASK